MEFDMLYRDIVESSLDGIWVFDLDGRTLYANPALRALFGVNEPEMRELTVFDSLDEPGKEQFVAHLRQLREGKVNEREVECRLVRRDGSYLWVMLRESLLLDADGSTSGVLHRLSDNSDRRRAVDDLTTSRRRLADAQRIARIGSWEWDVVRDEIYRSDELLALYGLDPDPSPAPYAAFINMVHEDDRSLVEHAVQVALAVPGEFVFVARMLGEDEAWVWTRGRGVSWADHTGRVVSMSGTHQDITETKLAEIALEDQVQQNFLLQAVASAANEATTFEEVLIQGRHLMLLHDDWERGRAFMPNESHTAVAPLFVVEEDQLEDLITPEAAQEELDLANRAFREKRAVWDEQRLTIAAPISYAHEVVAVFTITSAPPLYRFEMIESMVAQLVVQLGRVAERERVQHELADARDAAMEASRQKSEFLATMSHEIRTPLNGVIGLNELLLRTQLSADQHRLVSGVQVASRALLSVINDILDFSKIEAGKLVLERLDFEVRHVVDRVGGLLGESARAKGLELMISCHPDVPELVSGDPTRLAQVITNLGANAIKFTEQGEVHIRATANPMADGRSRLHVRVVDTGIGVSERDVGGLFDAFTQADASTTRRFGGTGLGLAISSEIVRALGGEIGFEPNPGGGSIFWFTADFDAPGGPGPDADDDYAQSWLTGRRVLVVDDNEHNRLILQEQLARWHVRPVAASSADGAERAMAEAHTSGDPFESVLLDMSMPDRDGLDLARVLYADPNYATVSMIMLTSATTPPAPELEKSGIVHWLTKPVLGAELRNAMLRHLAGVEPRHAPEAPVGSIAQGTAKRILVVEDNEINQLVAIGLLESLGYSVRIAENGLAGLNALEMEQFDAVLMDVQMPRMDGYEATRELRAREGFEHRLPVIAMTASAVEGERERCLAAGMNDFLTKPVDARALAAALDHWIADPPIVARRSVRPVSTERATTDLGGLSLETLDELRDLDPGNTAYLDRAISNFVTNIPGNLEAILQALDADDAPALRQVSHKLAGGALNLGVIDAGRTAQQIEQVADTGSVKAAHELVRQLTEDLERGRAALLDYQAQYKRG